MNIPASDTRRALLGSLAPVQGIGTDIGRELLAAQNTETQSVARSIRIRTNSIVKLARARISHGQSTGASGILGLILSVVFLASLAHCSRSGAKDEWASGHGKPAGIAVAKIGSRTLSTDDVAQHLAGQTEASRVAFADKAARRQFVDSVVRFELLAAAAEQRGYARDPQVIRGMKQQMIARMLEDDAAKQPDAEVSLDNIARYYDEHRDEFRRPAAVSVRTILVKDSSTAETIASQARSARKPDFAADQKAFVDLALRHHSPAGA